MQDMRDFRDAEAMARTLRAALAAKDHKITISESLEVIAQAFGVADWNTLAAAIRAEGPARRESFPPPPPPTTESVAAPRIADVRYGVAFSAELESTLHQALAYANQRKHEYVTLEHLLLALIDDVNASAVMKACEVDLGVLRGSLARYIDNELKELVINEGGVPKWTAGFQRVVQRAVIQAQGVGRDTVTGAELLVNIFAERESHAAYFLQEQEMTRYDAVSYISHGIGKRGRGAAD
jgi:Glyoxalase superfamily protein/Clp amino terminal domain, pathogenicity island component